LPERGILKGFQETPLWSRSTPYLYGAGGFPEIVTFFQMLKDLLFFRKIYKNLAIPRTGKGERI
jgi:hypothetical protein